MEAEIALGIVLAALSGLYALSWKNHGCIVRIEYKFNSHLQIEELKDEIIILKDEVRNIE